MGQNLTPGPPHNGEESTCQCRFDPWVRKIPWRSKWQPPSSVLAWAVPWREEPGGLQSMRLQRAGHDRTHRLTRGSRAGGRAGAAREPRGPQLNNQREGAGGWGESTFFLIFGRKSRSCHQLLLRVGRWSFLVLTWSSPDYHGTMEILFQISV